MGSSYAPETRPVRLGRSRARLIESESPASGLEALRRGAVTDFFRILSPSAAVNSLALSRLCHFGGDGGGGERRERSRKEKKKKPYLKCFIHKHLLNCGAQRQAKSGQKYTKRNWGRKRTKEAVARLGLSDVRDVIPCK